MNDRDVTIGLNLRNSGYNRGILQSAALTRVFSREVNSASRSMAFFEREGSAIDQNFGRYAKRLELTLDLIGALGPALVPISAAAIPALTGLAAGIGVAAAAGGTLMLAFKGVGDAVSKVNKADINPTTANLKNARIAMDGLSEAGQKMVMELIKFKSAYQDLRNAAQTGLFPGLTKSLDLLALRLPEVEGFVHQMGKALGELALRGSASLAGPQWDQFFKFITDKAPGAAVALGVATGHLAHALAELTMAFAGVNGDFMQHFSNSAVAIDKWAASLSKTKGFEEFVKYLHDTGPMVGDLLGSIAMALVHISEAAAPIGQATLPVLTSLFNAIGSIANSDFGTPLLGLLALTKAMALFGRLGKLSLVTGTRTMTAELGLLGPRASAAAAAVGFMGQSFASASTKVSLANRQLELSGREMTLLSARFNAFRTGGMTGLLAFNKSVDGLGRKVPILAKNLGVMGLMAASMSDKIGMSNTLMGASIGLIGGPWGAAIGGGIGLLMDMSDAFHDSGAAADDFTDSIDRQTLSLQAEGLAKIALSVQNFTGGMKEAGLNLAEVTAAAAEGGPALEAVINRIDAAQLHLNNTFAHSDKQYDAAYIQRNTRITNSLQGLRAELLAQSGAVGVARDKMKALKAAQEAAAEANRMAAAAADAQTDSVTRLNDAIDRELTGIKALNGLLSERSATLAYNQSLLDLNKSIKDNGSNWDKTSAKGIANWQALDSVASAAEQKLDNLQKRGHDAQAQNFYRQVTSDLRDFVKEHPAAAAAAKDIISTLTGKFGNNVFANAEADLKKFAGSTPKAAGAVQHLIDLMRNAGGGSGGMKQALAALRAFKDTFPEAAHAVQPLIDKLREANKVKVKPKVTLDDEDWRHKFDRITHGFIDLNGPKNAGRTLKIKVDETEAMNHLNKVKAGIAQVDKAKANPKVTAETGEAMAHLVALQAYINSMHGKSVTITTVNRSIAGKAGGGMIYGVGGPRDDANMARVSRGEFVMQASAVDYYGPGFMHDVNNRRFAGGGAGGGGKSGKAFLHDLISAIMGAGLGPGDTRKLTNEYQQVLKDFHKHGWTKDVSEAAHQLAKDLRSAAREQKKAIHDAFHNLEFDLSEGADSIRSEIQSLRQSLKEAGGVWNDALNRHAQKIIRLSLRYDQAADKLAKMTEFVDQVKGNFNNNAFGTDQGLAGFFAQTTTDTVRANAFSQTLAQLKAMGLSGDAYQQLAQSGDLNTAQQLLSGGSGTIAQFIAAIANKNTALNGLGDTAAQGLFGTTVDKQQALVASLQASVDRQEQVLRDLAGLISNVGTNLPRAAKKGAYDGTYEGVKDAMKGAGHALVRNGQRP
jgi:hypothetical protein